MSQTFVGLVTPSFVTVEYGNIGSLSSLRLKKNEQIANWQ